MDKKGKKNKGEEKTKNSDVQRTKDFNEHEEQLPPSNAAAYERDVNEFKPDFQFANNQGSSDKIDGLFDVQTSATNPEVKIVQRLEALYKTLKHIKQSGNLQDVEKASNEVNAMLGDLTRMKKYAEYINVTGYLNNLNVLKNLLEVNDVKEIKKKSLKKSSAILKSINRSSLEKLAPIL